MVLIEFLTKVTSICCLDDLEPNIKEGEPEETFLVQSDKKITYQSSQLVESCICRVKNKHGKLVKNKPL